MTTQAFKYSLQTYAGPATREDCPGCGAKRSFARYIDTHTGELLPAEYGRCNREDKCGYHVKPGRELNTQQHEYTERKQAPQKAFTPSFIDQRILESSLQFYDHNHFASFLVDRFGSKIATDAVARYLVGTSKHWPGATVFWQIDKKGKTRTGKVMLYDLATGKRVKKPFNHVTWVHTLLKEENFQLSTCLFGLHLLKPGKTVALVESEKTAIIASIYLPEFTWLAVGGSGLNDRAAEAVKGYKVILFPDLNFFEKWKEKGEKYGFKCMDLLELCATDDERNQGLDLADYLLRFEPEDFLKKPLPPQPEPQHVTVPVREPKAIEYRPLAIKKTENWEGEIAELKDFFTKFDLSNTIRTGFARITNPRKYVESNLAGAERYNGIPRYYTFVRRLKDLKTQLLKTHNNGKDRSGEGSTENRLYGVET